MSRVPFSWTANSTGAARKARGLALRAIVARGVIAVELASLLRKEPFQQIACELAGVRRVVRDAAQHTNRFLRRFHFLGPACARTYPTRMLFEVNK